MKEYNAYVGMDDRKDTIAVAGRVYEAAPRVIETKRDQVSTDPEQHAQIRAQREISGKKAEGLSSSSMKYSASSRWATE